MRTLWRGLLTLHGHLVDSRRALRWADQAAEQARQNTERTNAPVNDTAASAQPAGSQS
ncbi:hypothetical protein [Rhodanobacter ginsengiterrae]|uniref:hypothetical protein n=1 Tax=Rhodanobacter ginsengiterrae TaxID=2008451 RepID=UPI003CE6A800